MVSIAQRVLGGTLSAATATPFGALVGASFGYIYAKLADLPAGEAAKAYAVWTAAQTALTTFAHVAVEGKTAKAFAVTTLAAASTYIGVLELQKRGLIGHKLVVLFAVCQAISVLGFLASLGASNEELTTV